MSRALLILNIAFIASKSEEAMNELLGTLNIDLHNFCLALYSSPIILSVTMLLRDAGGVDKFNEIINSSLGYNKLLHHATHHGAAQCFPLATGNLIIMRPARKDERAMDRLLTSP
jgi:hypothetical protein